MRNIWILAGITFKEGIRNRALYGIFFLALVLCAANLILTHMFAYDLGKVAVDIGFSVVSFGGLVIIFFLGLNLLAKDLDKRTIYMVLSRPIARWEYVLGKFFGLSLLLLLAVIILGGCAVVSVIVATIGKEVYIPPNFSWATFLIALAYLFLSLLVVTAITFFFASVTSSTFIAMLLSLSTYFIGQNVELVRKLLSKPEDFPAGTLLKEVVKVISWIFPNLAAFDLKTTAAYGLTVKIPYLLWTAGYGIVYICLILVFTILVFQKRELT